MTHCRDQTALSSLPFAGFLEPSTGLKTQTILSWGFEGINVLVETTSEWTKQL